VPFTYPFARPAVTVDVVLFAMRSDDLAVLLVKRAAAPFKGYWALPGGFVGASEALERVALRELAEETGVTGIAVEQLGAFGDPGRDPRGHTVSIAYFGFAIADSHPVVAGDDAAEAEWHLLGALGFPSRRRVRPQGAPRIAFDHARIIARARERLQERMQDPARHAGFDLVPPRFTLSELQRVYEAVFARTLDKRNFRARLLAHALVEPVGTAHRTGPHRPAQLYRWRQPRKRR
jgi:8-oxo-dGTP diphosphatase